jgi:alkylation response protein AidB-like acyl-CoA dehydrogenase
VFTDIDSALGDTHRTTQAAAHRFARDVLRPAALAADAARDVADIIRPDSLWSRARREARQLGYHLATLPSSVGGLGLDALSLHIVLEEFGWASPGLALSIFADSFPAVATLMHRPRSPGLLDSIVRAFVDDTEARLSACAALSEPDHGTDALWAWTGGCEDPKIVFATRALRDGDHCVIAGQKSAWVSNGPIATHALTWVTVCDRGGRPEGGGIALVPLDAAGVSRSPATTLLGSRDFPQCALYFDAVRIPAEYLLVEPAAYEAAADQFLNVGGLSVGAVFLGLARAAFEEALTFCRGRIQGGTPLIAHQAVQLRLFDMFTRVEAARALSRQAMSYCLVPRDRVPIEYSTAVKIHCTQTAYEVAHEAVQLHGAAGLMHGALVEKLFRDARGGIVGDGCNNALALKRARDLIDNYIP